MGNGERPTSNNLALYLCRPEGLDRSDIVDPYVVLQLVGFPNDVKTCRTASVSDNGLM